MDHDQAPFLLAAALALAAPAAAQQRLPCAPAETVISGLQQRYGERPAFEAVAAQNGAPIIVLVNPETRTFSLVLILRERGVACLMVAGEKWTAIPDSAPGQPL